MKKIFTFIKRIPFCAKIIEKLKPQVVYGSLIDNDKVESFWVQRVKSKKVEIQNIPREIWTKSFIYDLLFVVETKRLIGFLNKNKIEWRTKNIIMQVISREPDLLEILNHEHKHDVDICFQAVRTNPLTIKIVPLQIKDKVVQRYYSEIKGKNKYVDKYWIKMLEKINSYPSSIHYLLNNQYYTLPCLIYLEPLIIEYVVFIKMSKFIDKKLYQNWVSLVKSGEVEKKKSFLFSVGRKPVSTVFSFKYKDMLDFGFENLFCDFIEYIEELAKEVELQYCLAFERENPGVNIHEFTDNWSYEKFKKYQLEVHKKFPKDN